MSNIKYRGVLQTTSLADLNTIVGQRENTIGALAVIGHVVKDEKTGDDPRTVLGFDAASFNPGANHTVIQATSDPAPAGKGQVCQGQIYILSVLTDCTAYR